MDRTDKVKFENVVFDVAANASKTEAEFVKHEAHHGLTAEQLKDVYKMIKEAAGKK